MTKRKHIITEQEYSEAKHLAKLNKHKGVQRRLRVIILRYEGMKDKNIADKLDYSGDKAISCLSA